MEKYLQIDNCKQIMVKDIHKKKRKIMIDQEGLVTVLDVYEIKGLFSRASHLCTIASMTRLFWDFFFFQERTFGL